MTITDFGKYYLDLDKVNGLKDKEEIERIHTYYRDMINCCEENRATSANSFFNTLDRAGYIKNYEQEERASKIGEIITG